MSTDNTSGQTRNNNHSHPDDVNNEFLVTSPTTIDQDEDFEIQLEMENRPDVSNDSIGREEEEGEIGGDDGLIKRIMALNQDIYDVGGNVNDFGENSEENVKNELETTSDDSHQITLESGELDGSLISLAATPITDLTFEAITAMNEAGHLDESVIPLINLNSDNYISTVSAGTDLEGSIISIATTDNDAAGGIINNELDGNIISLTSMPIVNVSDDSSMFDGNLISLLPPVTVESDATTMLSNEQGSDGSLVSILKPFSGNETMGDEGEVVSVVNQEVDNQTDTVLSYNNEQEPESSVISLGPKVIVNDDGVFEIVEGSEQLNGNLISLDPSNVETIRDQTDTVPIYDNENEPNSDVISVGPSIIVNDDGEYEIVNGSEQLSTNVISIAEQDTMATLDGEEQSNGGMITIATDVTDAIVNGGYEIDGNNIITVEADALVNDFEGSVISLATPINENDGMSMVANGDQIPEGTTITQTQFEDTTVGSELSPSDAVAEGNNGQVFAHSTVEVEDETGAVVGSISLSELENMAGGGIQFVTGSPTDQATQNKTVDSQQEPEWTPMDSIGHTIPLTAPSAGRVFVLSDADGFLTVSTDDED